jgi:CIC family chloride channel protein
MGAMLGGAVGAVFHMAFPTLTAPYGSYALAGMGAMIAGTMHAPITVILIIFELTGEYMIILPVMTACILSTLMSHRLLGGETIYSRKLIREGINLSRGRDLNVLSGLKVSDVMSQDVATVDEGEPLTLLIRRAIAHPHHTYVQVDEEGRISGLISLQRILEVMRDENLRDILVAQDVAMLEVPVLRADESLDEVIRRVGEHGLEEVPVTDPANPGVVIGVVRHNDIMQAYRRAIIQQDMSGFVADNLVRDPDRKEVELVDGYRMVEIKAPWNFRGKSIRELDISNRYGVQVILIRKKQHDSRKQTYANGATMNFVPHGDDVIEEGDVLVLVGDNKHLRKFTDI